MTFNEYRDHTRGWAPLARLRHLLHDHADTLPPVTRARLRFFKTVELTDHRRLVVRNLHKLAHDHEKTAKGETR
jgi:hypothetical protein